MQITIDGKEDIHNERRPLHIGGATFNRIINNLIKNNNLLPHTSIRVNVDKENIDDMNTVYNVLKNSDLIKYVDSYLGFVQDINGSYKSNTCLSLKEYSEAKFEYELYTKADFKFLLPRQKNNPCAASLMNSLVIDADGLCYKCWDDIGIKEKSIYDINTKAEMNFDTLDKYILKEPMDDKECSECKILPICMGLCPSKRFDNQEHMCSHYKFSLDKYLMTFATKFYGRSKVQI